MKSEELAGTGRRALTRAQWMVLLAAFLGWLFDGLEMGLFPIVARPALQDLLRVSDDKLVGLWNGRIVACFLFGAAFGGLVFGWLGDRIGRVRSMTLSILTYSIFTGLCYFATAPWHLGLFRFISALGMGGEWSLGVALVMECWPEKHRPLLAGLIGAASNVGFLMIAALGWFIPVTRESWRWITLAGAAPALLTFFIRLFVPESERWKASVKKHVSRPVREIFSRGMRKTTLLAIAFASIPLISTWGAISGWLPLWADQLAETQAINSIVAEERLLDSPLVKELLASGQLTEGQLVQLVKAVVQAKDRPAEDELRKNLLTENQVADEQAGRLIQRIRDALTDAHRAELKSKTAPAKALTQVAISIGAIIGCIIAPLVGAKLGRRPAYFGLCLLSLVVCAYQFRVLTRFDALFFVVTILAGSTTAAFYGWLPLYLPELFATRVRATGQGLSFNFGRILAGFGALQMGSLVHFLGGSYDRACAAITLIYVFGLVLIWLAPETKGKPLPE